MSKDIYISEMLEPEMFCPHKLNLITTGCGTGKTKWATNDLPNYWPDVQAKDILVVESRALAAAQIVTNTEANYVRWVEQIDKNSKNIHVTTLDAFGYMVMARRAIQDNPISNYKVFVFDEIHTLFVDNFIKVNNSVLAWLSAILRSPDVIVVGLTATPDVILEYLPDVNVVNSGMFMRYHAKHLICTNTTAVPELITTRLKGKSIVMCATTKQCDMLHQRFPNSFILTSRINQRNNAEMDSVRDIISKTQMLPETTPDGKPFDILLTTSTAREGYSIKAESGVKNVICYLPDCIDVVQFAGRVRGDIDNLVVVAGSPTVGKRESVFGQNSRKLFKEFYEGNRDSGWFESISQVIEEPKEMAEFYEGSGGIERFTAYIDKRWLLPKGKTIRDKEYWLTMGDRRDEVVREARENRIMPELYNCFYTFAKVEKWLEAHGYTVKSFQRKIGKHSPQIKVIMSKEVNT